MARRRGGRGGYQRPSSPAAASPPGALSQRTDGHVPVQNVTGLPYGDNKAANAAQRAAPLNPQGGGRPAPAGGGARPALGPEGIFGASTRPNEPLTAGVDFGPGPGAPQVPRFDEDVNYLVRAIAAENPHLADYLLGLADA